jgi:hypothetical protein
VRTYAGWNAATGLPTGPTQVTREDRGHSPSYVETLTMSATPSLTNGRPDGTEAVRGVQTLSREFTGPIGLVVERGLTVGAGEGWGIHARTWQAVAV